MTVSWLIAFWRLSSYNLYNKLVGGSQIWLSSKSQSIYDGAII